MKNKKEKLFLGLGVFFLLGSISMIKEDIFATIFFGLLSLLFLFLSRNLFFRKFKNNAENNLEDKKLENNITNTQLNQSKIFKPITLSFVSGLNLPENSKCLLTLEGDMFLFSVNGIDFSLNSNQITDISIKTTKDIEKQYVSSAGGAIAGGLIFGALGAVIGGRTKTKKNITIKDYLIFTYYGNDNNINYLVFDTNNPFKLTKIKKIIKYYKNNYSLKHIDLNL